MATGTQTTSPTGASSLVKDLIEAGIHFGQRSANWNPRMQAYIYGKKNSIHIIDIKETIKGLLLAKKFIAKTVSEGKDVVFVGTKRQARDVLLQRVADVKMPHVTERWLGGTLTNFRTIRARLKRLEELEAIEGETGFQKYSKKMESQLKREMRKIKRNLDGIRHMDKIPGAMVVIDTKREHNALLEARKLGVPTICLIDTDGNPELADIPIPGNDDSMRSIDVVIRELCAAVAEGKQVRAAATGDRSAAEGYTGGAADAGDRRPEADKPRRSSRVQFRSSEPASEEVGAGQGGA